MAERGLRLGLVIDLTDTDRYYDHGDIEGMCIEYEKVNCPGRGFVDRDDLVKTFIAVVDNFINSNPDDETVIGVHCTHGVNRSGYLVCRFLIDRLGWSSHDAIDAFERARGYPIERGAYVQALHRASKERRSKKRHKHSDELASSEESEMQRQSRKRSKHKKKHKSDTVSGDENGTPDIEAVWNQMAAVFEQHQSMMMTDQSASYGGEVSAELQRTQNSSHLSAEGSPFIGSTGTGEQMEDEEEGDHSGEQDYAGGDEGEQEISKSKKRRARRQRLQKEFELMKTGNFWKINEMQKEKFKGK
uniref:Tyrosine-protein phosphatase n=1 Tax=Ascaris suum TaxID=6253 RepID=F1L7H5_ASCSU